MPKTPPHDPSVSDEYVAELLQSPATTPRDLQLLKRLRPDLAKPLEHLEELRTRRLQQAAKVHGGFTTDNPLRFMAYTLGWKPTPAALAHGYKLGVTPQQARVVASVVQHKRTAAPSGHGVGKTKIAAGLALWFLYSRENSIVVTTASSWLQVEVQLWGEIRDAFRNSKVPLPGRLLETAIKIADKWYALGLSTDDANRFQGIHPKEAGRVLIIIDEATGVREELWDSADSMIQRDDDRILAIGNPTVVGSRFKRACDSGMWNVVRLDAREHPNVLHDNPDIVPGAVTKGWVDDKREEYGGEESPLFNARVTGIWPSQGEYNLIGLKEVTDAQEWDQREKERAGEASQIDDRGSALGVDIAGPGSDLAPCFEILRRRAYLRWWVVHNDLMDTVGRIVRTIRDGAGRVKYLAIDDTGIGNGVSSRLLELQRWAQNDPLHTNDPLGKVQIIRVNFGSNPQEHVKEKYLRIKDQLWWQERDSLKKGVQGLPTDAELAKAGLPKGVSLITQLTAPIYEVDSKGRIHVMDRRVGDSEKTKALPTKSPDLAHALMLANHAYRFLHPEVTVEAPPKTVLELQQRKFRDEIRAQLVPKRQGPPDTLSAGPEIYEYLDPFSHGGW